MQPDDESSSAVTHPLRLDTGAGKGAEASEGTKGSHPSSLFFFPPLPSPSFLSVTAGGPTPDRRTLEGNARPALSGDIPARQPSLANEPDTLFPVPSALDRPEPALQTTDPDAEERARSLKLETTGVTSHRQLQFRPVVSQALQATVAGKLRSAGLTELADTIEGCGRETIFLVCKGCSTLRKVQNHCDNHLCPRCQPRLARNRQEEIAHWAMAIDQPKHVVLTIRNTDTIDTDQLRFVTRSFARLRRLKFARHWFGGMWALEVTNERAGWHIHLHCLINARWIDAEQLAKHWAKIVGQDFAIVKVKDARAKDYVRECAKYCVKGTQLATWHAGQLKAFVDAISHVRTFGTFGDLYKRKAALAALLADLRDSRRACECGCRDWRAMTEDEYESMFCTWTPPPKCKVNPVTTDPQISLL